MGTTAIQKVTYEAGGQHIELTPATVKQYQEMRKMLQIKKLGCF